METFLVTGAAGFIGFHVCKHLLKEPANTVIGVDNFNDYYDVYLKKNRIAQIEDCEKFEIFNLDITDEINIEKIFKDTQIDTVIHLAAQAGVRYSIVNPRAYINSNLIGFANILEGCRHSPIKHLVFASSSSVYGANTQIPFATHQNVDHPISLYAATKKSNELMAHTYSHLFNMPVTGLRFFTVYGPWGRPDMALVMFTKAILDGEPIKIFNFGQQRRDFTYVDDIVEGIIRIAQQPAQPNSAWSGDSPDPSSSKAPYKIYNIGNSQPVELMHLIQVLEDCLGKSAKKEFLPAQPGDLSETFADVHDLVSAINFKPATSIEAGVHQFVEWYRAYYQV